MYFESSRLWNALRLSHLFNTKCVITNEVRLSFSSTFWLLLKLAVFTVVESGSSLKPNHRESISSIFFVRKQIEQLFSSYIRLCNFIAKILYQKRARKTLMKLTPDRPNLWNAVYIEVRVSLIVLIPQSNNG